jgi:6-phosphogluconolactonase
MYMNRCPADPFYIGTYSGGIYRCRLPEPVALAAEAPAPAFLAMHPRAPFLYAAGECPEGSVGAWQIAGETGGLTFAGRTSSGGAFPCHVALDATGSLLVACNYADGTVAAIRILRSGGFGETGVVLRHSGAGPNLQRQESPHPHGAFFAPDNRLVVVPDLALDRLLLYRAGPTLEQADPPFVALSPGCGPRHFAFHPNGRLGYVLAEMESSVALVEWEPLVVHTAVSALPPGFRGESIAAEIAIDASGRFLYCSNRGADSIAVFAIGARGELQAVQHISSGGRTPRHIAIDPTGEWLLAANQDSDSIAVFRRDAASGMLSICGFSIAVPAPACIVFCPSGTAVRRT